MSAEEELEGESYVVLESVVLPRLAESLNKIVAKLNKIDSEQQFKQVAHLDKVDAKFDKIDAKLDKILALETRLNEKLEKLDNIDAKLEKIFALETRLDEKLQKLDNLDQKVKKEAAADQADGAAHKPDVDARTVPQHLKRVVDECIRSNTILKLSAESAENGLDKVLVALHFCQLRIDAAPACARKACILVPTVPLIKQHFSVAKRTQGLRSKCVIGNWNVDNWGKQEWRQVVEQNDLLLITAQLFLDVLKAGAS